MQILLSTGNTYKTHTLKETEALALELGYGGLELMMAPHHAPPERAKRDTAYQTVTQVKVIHAPSDWFDQPRFRASITGALTVAAQLGVKMVNVHPASLSFGGRANVLEGIAYLQTVAAEKKITFLYEALVNPLGLQPERHERFIRQQAYRHVDEWVEDVLAYQLPATLDTCHVASWGVDPTDYIAPLGRLLHHVHVSDYSGEKLQEHLVPGTGDINWQAFLPALQAAHPDITVTVELMPESSRADSEAVAAQSIAFLRESLGSAPAQSLR